jgi:hypothetical protein
MTDKNNQIIEGIDDKGNTIKVLLKTPDAGDYRDSQIQYNKAFRKALDSGALLRQKLTDYMDEQGIWDNEKQKKNDSYIESINQKEQALNIGGIKLSEAKKIALELRSVRAEYRDFLSERNALDQNSVEGQADNARFSEIVRLCLLNPNSKAPYFQTQADYDSAAEQPWVIEASGKLAGMIYGLDPNYDEKLTENKFLKEFNFVNEDLAPVDESGHLVDLDGRLIDKDGRFIAYRTPEGKLAKNEEEVYFVNRDGKEVIKIVDSDGDESWVRKDMAERKPFLDDNGNPIIIAKKEDSEKEEDLVASDLAKEEKPKKRTAKKKVAEKDITEE